MRPSSTNVLPAITRAAGFEQPFSLHNGCGRTGSVRYKWEQENGIFEFDGKPLPNVSSFSHTFKGNVDANLVTILRKPVGTKEIVGGDGVVYVVPDASGGKVIEPLFVDVMRSCNCPSSVARVG